eukprot:m.1247613 g.1247613  ORF g.1247613 m.1247613 type:complete len:1159 (-) comp24692_c0_seq3:2242-5718(-)
MSPVDQIISNERDIASVSRVLRDATETALRTHGAERLDEVQDIFLHFDPVLLATLSPVILLPVKKIIESSKASEASRILAFSCVTVFFSRTAPVNAEFTTQNLAYASLALDEKLSPALVSSSEEVKLAIVKSILAVIESATEDAMALLEKEDKLPVLGHAISTLLSFGSRGSSQNRQIGGVTYGRELRCAAIEAVHTLCGKIPHPATLATFLPGIASALGRVVTGDFKQGYTVFSSAILAWSSVVVRVVCDKEYSRCLGATAHSAKMASISGAETEDPAAETDATGDPDAAASANGLKVVQNEVWWTTTAGNLRQMLSKMVTASAAQHSHYKVRLALVTLADNVLRQCLCTMTFAAPLLVELLVGFSADHATPVSAAASRALTAYADELRAAEARDESGGSSGSSEQQQQARHTLQGLCEENFASVLVSFPRVLHGAADDEIARNLTLIGSYIAILGTFGSRVKVLLRGPKMLTRLQHVIETVLEADISAVHLIAERLDGGSTDADVRVAGMTQERGAAAETIGLSGGTTAFRWFSHKEVLHAVMRVCHLLGHFGDIHALMDHFVSVFRASAPGGVCSQTALILSELLRGATMPAHALAWTATPPSTTPPPSVTPPPPSMRSHDGARADAGSSHTDTCNTDHAESQHPRDEGFVGAPRTREGKEALVVLARTVVQALTDDEIWRLPTHRSDTVLDAERDPARSMLELTEATDGSARMFVANAILQCRLLYAIATIAEALGPHFDELVIHALYPVMELFGSHTAAVAHAAGDTLQRMCNALGFTTVSSMVCHNADYLINSISLNMRYVEVNPRATIVFHSMLQTCDLEILSYLQDTIEEVFAAVDGFHTDTRLEQFLSILHALASSFRRWDVGAHVQAPLSKEEEQAQQEAEEGDGGDDKGSTARALLPFDWRVTMQHTIERCTHQLACPRARLRLVVLDTMCHAAHALHAEEDHLLPAINTLWPALVARLRDPDPSVRRRAVDVAHDIVVLAPKFMQSRIHGDVIPALRELLGGMHHSDSHAEPGMTQPSSNRFRYSAGFKVESALLRLLTAVLPSLDLGTSAEGAALASACFPYLSSTCPQELQSATRAVFEELLLHDPDAVWYLLVTRCAPTRWTAQECIPAAAAHLYSTPQCPPPDNVYRVNVDYLLARLASIEA